MKEELTMEFVKSLMDETYTLAWVEYDDNFNFNHALIQKCLSEKSPESLWERIDSWYSNSEWESAKRIIKKLKEECIVFHDFDEDRVETFFEKHDDEIREEIYARDDSTVLTDLIRHTDDIPIRVEMLSDNDCINSHWWESQDGYRYEDSYFGDMVDALNLNPAKVKRMLVEKGYTVHGRFPDKRYRNGKEQVSYEHFYQELINSCCGANLLTYIGKVSLKDLYDIGFSFKEAIIPKGNYCGIFSSVYGGGSLLGMELKQDVRLSLGLKGCCGLRFRVDNERSRYECSIRHVYGVDDSFFGGKIRLIASSDTGS